MDLNERNSLVESLLKGTVTVTFQKVNSDEVRVMPCTLNEEFLLASNAITKDSQSNLQEDKTEDLKPTISVWSLDSNGWRSFRFENVLGWEVLGE